MQTHVLVPEQLYRFIKCLCLVLMTIIHTKLYKTSMKATVDDDISATDLIKTISYTYTQ